MPPCCTSWAETARGEDAAPEEQPDDTLAVGARVVHDEWGAGTIAHREGDQLTVVFDTVGYKTLSAEIVAERGLLEPS